MASEEDPLPYLESVGNGFVNPMAFQEGMGRATYENLVESHYRTEELLEEVDRELESDFVYDIETEKIPVDRIGIDGDLGIINVLGKQGDDFGLEAQYTLLGLLTADTGLAVYFGTDYGVLVQDSGKITHGGDWGPHLAAAYVGMDSIFELSPEALMEHDEVITAESPEEDVRITPVYYTAADARSDIKTLDTAFKRLKDQSVNSLLEFEASGEARIDRNEHPFNERAKGVRGVQAGRKFSHFFNSLYNSGILDYTIKVEGHNDDDGLISIREDVSSDSVTMVRDFLEKDTEMLTQEDLEKIVESGFRG